MTVNVHTKETYSLHLQAFRCAAGALRWIETCNMSTVTHYSYANKLVSDMTPTQIDQQSSQQNARNDNDAIYDGAQWVFDYGTFPQP